MQTKFYFLPIILLYLFALSMIGCGEDDTIEVRSVKPADGSTITPDTIITISFTGTPEKLTVSQGNATQDDNSVTIEGPFSIGELEIEISWEGGNDILNYTVLDEEEIPEGMALIPQGVFKLGNISGEGGNVEQPGHSVLIDAFYIDKYEVTNAEYKEFVDANPEWQKDSIDSKLHDGNYLQYWTENTYSSGLEDHPVVSVSWYAAAAYAAWVNKRLPTEAEWEKAARGGVEGQKYPWGNAIDEDKANYSLNVGYTGSTTPIGDYPPNGYELYDMVGNALEWCIDAYQRDYYDNPSDNNPIGGTNSIMSIVENYKNIVSSRSIRGGSWVEDGQPRIWITYRRGNEPARTSHLIGFRCAKSIN